MSKVFNQSYEELYGDNDSCCCDTCMAVSEVALKTSDLDYIDGYRRGLGAYHFQHSVSIQAYATAIGYPMAQLQNAIYSGRKAFIEGYVKGYNEYKKG